ncbi:hypothetical protein PROFUN_09066 [Planoprotostelium fungivorum]|uniref:Uncharacterized protein n=1 Tax=Planoprotostelium fungivorum TaxID=1890364 RepID=A0A2P6NIF9_9EUKA|nr:hypothetical protein PROFUN_09066 [Planoprotostelium fungivorum]
MAHLLSRVYHAPRTRTRVERTRTDIDPSMIQIHAGEDEVARRMHAFMEHKKSQNDESNQREFSRLLERSRHEARTATKQIQRSLQIKKHKVINFEGVESQTDSLDDVHQEPFDGVSERLSNLESYMGCNYAVPLDTYTRLKRLEDRLARMDETEMERLQRIEQLEYKRALPQKKRARVEVFTKVDPNRDLHLLENLTSQPIMPIAMPPLTQSPPPPSLSTSSSTPNKQPTSTSSLTPTTAPDEIKDRIQFLKDKLIEKKKMSTT